jgi:hypothetical protein
MSKNLRQRLASTLLMENYSEIFASIDQKERWDYLYEKHILAKSGQWEVLLCEVEQEASPSSMLLAAELALAQSNWQYIDIFYDKLLEISPSTAETLAGNMDSNALFFKSYEPDALEFYRKVWLNHSLINSCGTTLILATNELLFDTAASTLFYDILGLKGLIPKEDLKVAAQLFTSANHELIDQVIDICRQNAKDMYALTPDQENGLLLINYYSNLFSTDQAQKIEMEHVFLDCQDEELKLKMYELNRFANVTRTLIKIKYPENSLDRLISKILDSGVIKLG